MNKNLNKNLTNMLMKNKKGKLLVIEGVDSAGKSSQVKLITNYYENQGLKVINFHFPTYTHNEFGKVITSFIQGNFGNSDKVNPYFVANIYAMDRYLFRDELNKMLEEYDIVILDRYVLSNAAYQAAKFPINSKEASDIVDWILEFEFDFLDLPEQDLCLFLNVPMETIKNRLTSTRTGTDRDYLDGKSDIHEEDLELQKRVNYTYLNMEQIAGYEMYEYIIIDCNDYNPDEIFSLYIDHLKI